MCCHDGIIISLWCKGLNESCKTEELYAAAECYRYRLHLVVDVDLSYIWCQLIILILLWCISSHNIDLPSAFICKWNAVLWQSCGASIFASKLRTSVGHSALVHRHYCLRGTQEHMWDDLLYAHAGAAIDGHHIIMVMAVGGRLGGTFDEMESFCCRIAINNQKSEAISATTMLHYIFWYLAF